MKQQVFTDADYDSQFIWDALEILIEEGYIIDAFSYTDALKHYIIVAHKNQ